MPKITGELCNNSLRVMLRVGIAFSRAWLGLPEVARLAEHLLMKGARQLTQETVGIK